MQGATGRKPILIHLADHCINGVVRSYSEGLPGQVCALINSNGFLEVFLREGHAASRLGVCVGAELRLDRRDP
jgi:S-adenosylmethionine hydrolase